MKKRQTFLFNDLPAGVSFSICDNTVKEFGLEHVKVLPIPNFDDNRWHSADEHELCDVCGKPAMLNPICTEIGDNLGLMPHICDHELVDAIYSEQLAGVQRWIPVTDGLPPIGEKVMVIADGHSDIQVAELEESHDWYPLYARVVYWSYLPSNTANINMHYNRDVEVRIRKSGDERDWVDIAPESQAVFFGSSTNAINLSVQAFMLGWQKDDVARWSIKGSEEFNYVNGTLEKTVN